MTDARTTREIRKTEFMQEYVLAIARSGAEYMMKQWVEHHVQRAAVAFEEIERLAVDNPERNG